MFLAFLFFANTTLFIEPTQISKASSKKSRAASGYDDGWGDYGRNDDDYYYEEVKAVKKAAAANKKGGKNYYQRWDDEEEEQV